MNDDFAALEVVEQAILEQVKFIDLMLEEIRNRNEKLQNVLGMSYAKYIGLGTPYEECIHSLRKVKGEFDVYLKMIRDDILKKFTDIQRKSRKN